jgi:hypothetical protein
MLAPMADLDAFIERSRVKPGEVKSDCRVTGRPPVPAEVATGRNRLPPWARCREVEDPSAEQVRNTTAMASSGVRSPVWDSSSRWGAVIDASSRKGRTAMRHFPIRHLVVAALAAWRGAPAFADQPAVLGRVDDMNRARQIRNDRNRAGTGD